MKLLFSTFGSLGDIHPYLALALEAKAQGFSPVVATSARYRAKVEALGIQFRSVPPDLPENDEFAAIAKAVMNERDGPRYLFEELLSPSIEEQYLELLAASEDVDLIVTHPAALAGPLVARKTGKRWLSSVLAPISLWSRADPLVPPTRPYLDRLRVFGPMWGHFVVGMGRLSTQRWVRQIERFAAKQGVSGGHPLFEGQFSPHGTLALFSRHFAAPQSDWPQRTTATGFCFYDAQGYSARDDGADWKSWMRDGEQPVVFALGSSAVYDGQDVWEHAVAAAKRASERVVLLTANTFSVREEGVLCVPYAPYSEMFPLARRIYHQGGVGTTAQALRAGVIQSVIPFAHDQADNGARIARLGVGDILRRTRLSRLSLDVHSKFDQMQAPRARELGERIREENGPRAALSVIERAAQKH